MALSPDAPIFEPLNFAALLVGVGLSLFVLYRIDDGSLGERLRSRFVLGVPWGTITVIVAVWTVFFLIQGGDRFGGPVVVGFRSWSYFYPLGMILAPFSHGGTGHLVGNLVSAAAFAPVAEYAWSHYPRQRGSQSFSSPGTNPFVRILLFVAAVFVVGLATSLLIPGALIGFSGVVFAFAGAALVSQPIIAIVALAGERVIRLLYFTFNDPLLTQQGQTQFVTPFWADIAVQGHLLGFVIGVLVALALARRRDEWPTPRYVWGAVLVYGIGKGLYALYWYLGGTRYVLYRGVGAAMVFILAAVVAIAFLRGDRQWVPRIGLSRRRAAAALLAAIIVVIGVAAVPYNTATVTSGPETESGIQIRDYSVSYAEDVTNRYVASVEIPFVGGGLGYETSGVIVASDERNAWEVAVPAQRLAVRGVVVVPVGGLGWRETVIVNRTGWSVVDGGATYEVFVRHDGAVRRVFEADPVRVPAVINGSTVAIEPADPGFELNVSRNRSVVDTVPVPSAGENVTVADITFNRTGQNLFAIHDKTRLRIARLQLSRRN